MFIFNTFFRVVPGLNIVKILRIKSCKIPAQDYKVRIMFEVFTRSYTQKFSIFFKIISNFPVFVGR